jgi:AcrR family transcriptional regulator
MIGRDRNPGRGSSGWSRQSRKVAKFGVTGVSLMESETRLTPAPGAIHSCLNAFSRGDSGVPVQTEDTGTKILNCALDLFRTEGFDSTKMRVIATKAGVATGAAYYYYASKDAIVLAFYQRAYDEMQPTIEASLYRTRGLEARLHNLIRVKLDYFRPNREVLRALLRNGADPKNPVSPFSAETKAIRDMDIEWFRRILVDCGIRIPRDLEPHLPYVLWFFQMGIIFFWVTDDSPGQARTMRLLKLSAGIVTTLVRLSSLPLMRPVRKTALELIEIVKGE